MHILRVGERGREAGREKEERRGREGGREGERGEERERGREGGRKRRGEGEVDRELVHVGAGESVSTREPAQEQGWGRSERE
jgi:hypothetical protein